MIPSSKFSDHFSNLRLKLTKALLQKDVPSIKEGAVFAQRPVMLTKPKSVCEERGIHSPSSHTEEDVARCVLRGDAGRGGVQWEVGT